MAAGSKEFADTHKLVKLTMNVNDFLIITSIMPKGLGDEVWEYGAKKGQGVYLKGRGAYTGKSN